MGLKKLILDGFKTKITALAEKKYKVSAVINFFYLNSRMCGK